MEPKLISQILDLEQVVKEASRKNEAVAYELSQSSFTLNDDGSSKIMGIVDWVDLNREQTLEYILGIIVEYFLEDE